MLCGDFRSLLDWTFRESVFLIITIITFKPLTDKGPFHLRFFSLKKHEKRLSHSLDVVKNSISNEWSNKDGGIVAIDFQFVSKSNAQPFKAEKLGIEIKNVLGNLNKERLLLLLLSLELSKWRWRNFISVYISFSLF